MTEAVASTPYGVQLQLPFNRVELDKTIHLVPSPSKVVGDWGCNVEADSIIVADLSKQFGKSRFFSGKRFHAKVYKSIISCVLANLLNSDVHEKQLTYSRSTSNDNAAWIKVFDFLCDIGLIANHIAKPSKDIFNQSWAVATDELRELIKHYQVGIELNENSKALVIRGRKEEGHKVRKELPYPKRRTDALKLKRLKKPVDAYNKTWVHHSVTIDSKPVVPFAKRLFNESLNLGGRFYGHTFQNIPSADRERLLIDGKETTELDYKSQHIAILYAWEGLELEGDPYAVEGFNRSVMKSVLLRAVNVRTISDLMRSITISASQSGHDKYKLYKKERHIYEVSRANGYGGKEPHKPKWVKRFIHGIPVGTDAKKLIQALSERHSAIFHHFGSTDIGLRLQAADSAVMGRVIQTLSEADIPLLPVHDSIIVQRSSAVAAMAAMRGAFKAELGTDCVIERK